MPYWQVLGMIFACLGLAYRLLPTQDEAAFRHFADGDFQRAADATFGEIGPVSLTTAAPATGAATAEFSPKTQENEEVIEVLAPAPTISLPPSAAPATAREMTPEAATKLFSIALEAARNGEPIPYDHLEAVLKAHPDPKKAFEVFQAEKNLHFALRRPFYLAMAERFLGMNQPGDAAECLAPVEAHEGPSAEVSRKLILSYRYSDQPAKGLEVLARLQKAGGDNAEIQDLEIALLRDAARHEEAVDLVLKRKASADASLDEETLDFLVDMAWDPATQLKVIPLLTRHIAAQPGGEAFFMTVSQAEAARAEQKLAVASGRTLRDALTLANFCLWNDRYEQAFWIFAELARLDFEPPPPPDGEVLPTPLQHCLDLAGDLSFQTEMARLLTRLPLSRFAPDQLAECARLCAMCGETQAAIAFYRKQLENCQTDAKAARELADLHIGCSDFEAVVAVCERFLEKSDDAYLRRRLGEAKLALSEFNGALEQYRVLAQQDEDVDSQEIHTALAEALEQPAELIQALRRELSLRHDILLLDSLVYIQQQIGQPAEALKTLHEALTARPKDTTVRLALGRAALNTGQYTFAIKSLAHDSLSENLEAHELLLEAAREGGDPRLAHQFYSANKAAARFPLSDSLAAQRRNLIVHKSIEAPEPAEPVEVVAEVAEVPELDARVVAAIDHSARWDQLRDLAEKALEKTDFPAARRAMDEYMKINPEPSAYDWNLLGSICKAQGDEAASRAAYQRYLRRIREQLQSKTVGRS